MTDPEQPAFTDRPLPPAQYDPDLPPAPTPRGWPHPSIGWAVLWCVALVLFSQIPGSIAAVAVFVLGVVITREPFPVDTAGFMASTAGQAGLVAGLLFSHAVIFGMALLLLRVVAGRDWPRQVAFRLPAWHQALSGVMMFPALWVLATALYLLLREVLNVPSMKDAGLPGMSEMEKVFGGWPLWLGVFLIGVVPAFSEEFWCRAFLGRGLVGQHGYILGVVFTSLLFGLIHIDPAQGLMAAGMGLVLHTAYLLTRSLWVPMILHFLNNASSVLFSRFPETAAIEGRLGGDLWPVIVLAAAVLAFGLLALWQGRTRSVTPPGETPWEPPYQGVECPPRGSATKAVAPPPPLAVSLGLLASLATLVWVVWDATR